MIFRRRIPQQIFIISQMLVQRFFLIPGLIIIYDYIENVAKV